MSRLTRRWHRKGETTPVRSRLLGLVPPAEVRLGLLEQEHDPAHLLVGHPEYSGAS